MQRVTLVRYVVKPDWDAPERLEPTDESPVVADATV